MNINDIKDMSTEEIAEFCDKNYFNFPILQSIETPEDLMMVSDQMGILMGYNAFLSSILAHLKYMVRNAKNEGNKELANELIDKKTIIEHAFGTIQQHYASLSRRVSIHKDVMYELNMTEGIKKG